MSQSLLYHAFGLVGYRYVRQEFREGQVMFHIEQPRERLRCDRPRGSTRCEVPVAPRNGIERSIKRAAGASR
jgi:hypothetical protein